MQYPNVMRSNSFPSKYDEFCKIKTSRKPFGRTFAIDSPFVAKENFDRKDFIYFGGESLMILLQKTPQKNTAYNVKV